jgi:hypothetical protein
MADERGARVDRIIAFSDGVVAIAITLLILPLTEIHPAEGATLADIVVENRAALGAFAPHLRSSPTTGRFITTSSGHSAPQFAHRPVQLVLAGRDRLSALPTG